MSDTDRDDLARDTKRLDRPSPSIPNVDRPWDDAKDHSRRMRVRSGDRAAHRAYHGLYEDMLN